MTLSAAGAALSNSNSNSNSTANNNSNSTTTNIYIPGSSYQPQAPLPANASVASQLSLMGSMTLPDDEFSEGATVSINQPVGSLSISPSSRDVCLASRKGLYILDLANLEKTPRFIPQGGTWQIAE